MVQVYSTNQSREFIRRPFRGQFSVACGRTLYNRARPAIVPVDIHIALLPPRSIDPSHEWRCPAAIGKLRGFSAAPSSLKFLRVSASCGRQLGRKLQ